MISIITPTHNPRFIYELYESIRHQTYTDWEWVILTNNGARVNINDDKVRIIDCPFKFKSVGFLKKYAFMLAKGDILVEVDHDDLLTPDALEELNTAFQDEKVGFVYSNNAKLSDNFTPYNPIYGWEHRKFNWKGKEYYEMLSFSTEHLVSFIWYMPDHVRAWRSDIYRGLGGHDETLEVLDDQDLIIRTYLKTKFKHINKCLYLYRITGDNTWLERNKLIQTETVNIYNKNAHKIAERWTDLKGLKKIDLGGGFNSPPGYTSIDLKNADITADLSKGIPLPDNSCGVVRACDFLEHIQDKQKIMSEIWRVLSDGGWLMAETPSTDGRGAFQDPTHVSYWNQNSFWYWTRKEQAQYIYNDTIKFQEYRLETIFPSEYHKINNIPYVVTYLSAIKSNQRRPHKITI